jgi:peptidoglycan hydrolase-like protein with peptidoglycan-binding domain/GH24 family phage-related lysozyme (muramidase)
MKHDATKSSVTAQHSSGLHNDFSAQEETMTNGAMPPEFALTASGASSNPGMAKPEPKKESAPKLHVTGVPPELVTMLTEFEGVKWIVYADQNGHLTGGMGHRIKDDELAAFPKGAAIPQAQVEAWAQQDVLEAWNRAKDMSAELGVDDHDFFVAMASMCFQNGLYWNTKHVKTWALMKEHRWEEAAVECADSDWARQTPDRVPGFQAALRSQAQAGTGDVLHKHARDQKSKAAKMEAAKAAKPSKGSEIAVPEGREGMKQVQQRLQALGLYNGKIDGIATSSKGESNTTKGIKQFQQMRKLPVTGVVDAATWAALRVPKADDGSTWDKIMAKVDEKQKEEASKPKAEKEGDDTGWTMDWWKNIGIEPTVGFAHESFAEVAPLLEREDHVAQPAGSGECYVRSVEMVQKYMKKNRASFEEKGVDVDEYLKVAAPCNQSRTNHEDYLGHLALVREDHANRKEIIDDKGGDNIAKVLSYDEGLLDKHDEFQAALTYIDDHLAMGIPVVVGVDHMYSRVLAGKNKASSYTLSGNWYNEGTTDHFIVVVGSGFDGGKKFYSYFDPGKNAKVDNKNVQRHGANTQGNRIYQSDKQGEQHIWRDEAGASNGRAYTLSIVCLFQKDMKQKEDTILAQCQIQLKALGYDAGKGGTWSKGVTDKALQKFQEDHGLPVTVELDTHTRNAIRSEFERKNSKVAST